MSVRPSVFQSVLLSLLPNLGANNGLQVCLQNMTSSQLNDECQIPFFAQERFIGPLGLVLQVSKRADPFDHSVSTSKFQPSFRAVNPVVKTKIIFWLSSKFIFHFHFLDTAVSSVRHRLPSCPLSVLLVVLFLLLPPVRLPASSNLHPVTG